jgi:iron(III) transport system permease protein
LKSLFAKSVLALTLLFFAVFFLWPLWTTLETALLDSSGHVTTAYLVEVFINPLYREGLLNSFWIALWTTLGCILIAMPLAMLYTSYRFPGREWFNLLMLSPLMLPPFVGALGVQMILSRHGSLNSFLIHVGLSNPDTPVDWLGEGRLTGIVVMNVLHLFPMIYINVSNTLAKIDPDLDEAANGLGANAFRRFRRILLPLTLPGLFAGASITFIWAFTELGVPLIFDFERVTSVQIFNAIRDLNGNPFPYALVFVLLVVTSLMFVLSRLVLRGRQADGGGRATRSRRLKCPQGWIALSITGLFLGVTLLAMGPHFAVLLLALGQDWYNTVFPQILTLDHFRDALGHDLTLPSISNSIRYASASTLVDLILGSLIAWVLIRSRIAGRTLLDALVMLPLSVPGIVLAFGYLALSREGKGLDFLVDEGDPFWLLVIAYAMRRLPYVVRAMSAGLLSISPVLEEAAQNLGAPPWRSFLRITVPLALPSLLAGGTLAFAFAMLEVSDSMVLAQRTLHFPITKAIYTLAGTIGEGPALAAALGAWSMVFLTILIGGLSFLVGRKNLSLMR